MAEAGHNSGVAEVLRQFIERIERLEEEKRDALSDIKEVYAEAKGRGYDNKAMRKLIAIRKQDPEKRSEENAMLVTYGLALGIDVFG